jgi:hypothetical protein
MNLIKPNGSEPIENWPDQVGPNMDKIDNLLPHSNQSEVSGSRTVTVANSPRDLSQNLIVRTGAAGVIILTFAGRWSPTTASGTNFMSVWVATSAEGSSDPDLRQRVVDRAGNFVSGETKSFNVSRIITGLAVNTNITLNCWGDITGNAYEITDSTRVLAAVGL